jgi:phage protein D
VNGVEQLQSPGNEMRPTIEALVGVGAAGTPLVEAATELLVRVVVDNHLHLPGMFELTFRDLDGTVLTKAGLTIGTQVSVTGGTAGGLAARLIVGEVTAIEGAMFGMTAYTTVRGYTTAHRLRRARRSRTFLNVTDTDVARQLATEAKLSIGQVVESGVTHAYVAQVNQTDGDFLAERAMEIGYETGVANGQFYFRPASTVSSPAVPSARPTVLTFREDLTSFQPRVSAGNLTPEVEVRVWDPLQVRAFASQSAAPSGAAPSPASLAAQFAESGTTGVSGAASGLEGIAAGAGIGAAESGIASALSGGGGSGGGSGGGGLPGGSGGGAGGLLGGSGGLLGGALGGATGTPLLGGLGASDLGPPPNPAAHVVTDRPVADGTTMLTAGAKVAGAFSTDLGSTFAEAEGDAIGNPAIQPGAVVEVANVHAQFAGKWLVSHAKHVFDDREYGYHTTFAAHGREDRSMLGLTARALTSQRPRIDGVVCGVVSSNLDPLGRARVKAVLPWLSPDFETDWAPVAQVTAGTANGALFVPNVGDEVLLAFEFGDPRKPYVVGSLVNNHTGWGLQTGGPMAILGSLANGLGGIGGDIAGLATGLESLANTVSALTPLGQMVGATGMGGTSMSGGAPQAPDFSGGLPTIPGLTGGGQAGAGGGGSLGAVLQSRGMVGEVVRSGFVTSTGNALVFNDEPMPGAAPATGGGAGGLAGGMGGGLPGMGGAGAGGATGTPAIASSVTLGTHSGNHGLYIDQVSSMVILQANATPGVSMSEMPMLVITTGEQGSVVINGGQSLTLASEKSIQMVAPEILIAGETITVAGELIPLTPG